MSIEWYDMIARRNGGYQSNALFTVEGLSGERVFEERLIQLIPQCEAVLDAGCGHGEFTLAMAQYAKTLTAFDFSRELITIAKSLQADMNMQDKTRFVYATTKERLPFADGEFDLVYTRRGPTSILNHSRILRSGGMIMGIHSSGLDRVQERLEQNGFIDVRIEIFDQAMAYFPNENEFAKFLSAIPGNPDYTLPENHLELEQKIEECTTMGKLTWPEWRFIWSARRP